MCNCCEQIVPQAEDVTALGCDARNCPIAPGHRVSRRALGQLFAVASAAILASCGGGLSSSGLLGVEQRTAVLMSLMLEQRRRDPFCNPHRRPDGLAPSTRRQTWRNQKLRVFDGRGPFTFTSDFGWRPLRGRNDFHGGIDMKAAIGTNIISATSGTVVFRRTAGYNGGIVIYDRRGVQHTYYHILPASGLDVGDRVREGQYLGDLADWGSNTHLHYSMHIVGRSDDPNQRNDFNAIDPLYVLKRGLTI